MKSSAPYASWIRGDGWSREEFVYLRCPPLINRALHISRAIYRFFWPLPLVLMLGSKLRSPSLDAIRDCWIAEHPSRYLKAQGGRIEARNPHWRPPQTSAQPHANDSDSVTLGVRPGWSSAGCSKDREILAKSLEGSGCYRDDYAN
jgi:hypothetical protein